jgi:hypothetical protein
MGASGSRSHGAPWHSVSRKVDTGGRGRRGTGRRWSETGMRVDENNLTMTGVQL